MKKLSYHFILCSILIILSLLIASCNSKKNCEHNFVMEYYQSIRPTCTTNGSLIEICSKCGQTRSSEWVSTGHNYEAVDTKSATCTEDGVEYLKCTICNDETENKIDAFGHNYVDTIKIDSSCKSTGVMTHTCSECGDVYETTISRKSHNYKLIESKSPTCSSSGYRYYECVDCGITKKETIEKTNHVLSYNGSCAECGANNIEIIIDYMNDIGESSIDIEDGYYGLFSITKSGSSIAATLILTRNHTTKDSDVLEQIGIVCHGGATQFNVFHKMYKYNTLVGDMTYVAEISNHRLGSLNINPYGTNAVVTAAVGTQQECFDLALKYVNSLVNTINNWLNIRGLPYLF